MIDFDVEYEIIDNSLAYKFSYRLKRMKVMPEEIEEWNKSIKEISKKFSESIILKKP